MIPWFNHSLYIEDMWLLICRWSLIIPYKHTEHGPLLPPYTPTCTGQKQIKNKNNNETAQRAHFDSHWNFDVKSKSKFRRLIFNAFSTFFSTPNKKPLNYRRRFDVEISTTVEMSNLCRRPSKYSYVFNAFSTSIQSWINVENARWAIITQAITTLRHIKATLFQRLSRPLLQGSTVTPLQSAERCVERVALSDITTGISSEN